VVDDPLVPVVAAEAVVAGGRTHLDGREVVVLAHLEEGDVERSTTEVEDQDELVFLALVEAVGEGGASAR
jgi:NAD-specific glutamate dehydrogenase.